MDGRHSLANHFDVDSFCGGSRPLVDFEAGTVEWRS